MAADNRSLARFELAGIPPAPRGVPKIQVTFKLDADGIVSVEAKDLGTGKAQSVRVKPASGLSQSDVDKLVEDAERFRDDDDGRRQLAEIRNQAQTLVYTTEAALEGYADLVDHDMLDEARTLAASLRTLLEASADAGSIRDGFQKLEAITFQIAEKIYGGDAPPGVG